MLSLLTYLDKNYQPICGLIFGIFLLISTFLLNYGRTKTIATRWLRQNLYNNNERSVYLTMKFIDGISKFSLLFGLSLILLAIYFLERIR
jgi:hypothetical protein